MAFSGFPRARRGQLDFVPVDAAAFKDAAKQARVKVEGPKTCFLAEGDDRRGAGAELMAKLAEAKINVTALQAICAGNGRNLLGQAEGREKGSPSARHRMMSCEGEFANRPYFN